MENKFAVYSSPLGLIVLESDGEYLISLTFTDNECNILNDDCPAVLRQAIDELDRYFKGELKQFRVPYKINKSKFSESVYQVVKMVDYGSVITYRDVAESIGRPGSYRAVGMANSRNPIPVIIPCHRIIASSGKMQGYNAGIWRKKWLLEHEKTHSL